MSLEKQGVRFTYIIFLRSLPTPFGSLSLLAQLMQKYFTTHNMYVTDFALLTMQTCQEAFTAHLNSNQYSVPLQQVHTQRLLKSNRGKN